MSIGFSQAAATPSAPPPPAGSSGLIPLSQIAESLTNPRKRFDEEKLAELAQSIASVGVIQPILVRPRILPGGTLYELVSGARRLRATKLADVETIPAVIRELTDEQVAEIQLVENSQRADVHPLEECDAFRRMIDQHGYTVQQLAEKIGHSETYVRQRLALAGLIPVLRELLDADRMSFSQAIRIAPLLEADQELIATRLFRLEPAPAGEGLDGDDSEDLDSEEIVYSGPVAITVGQLDQFIENHIRLKLDSAVWPMAIEPFASMTPPLPVCQSCPKRTGAQPALFAGVVKGDRCLDRHCFEEKGKAWIRHVYSLEEAHGRRPVLLGYTEDSKIYAPLPVVDKHRVKVAQSEACDAARVGVVLGQLFFWDGEKRLEYGAGETLWVCDDARCPVHKRESWERKASGSGAGADWKERKKQVLEAARSKTASAVFAELCRQPGEPDLETMATALDVMVERLTHDWQVAVGKALDLQPLKPDSYTTNWADPIKTWVIAGGVPRIAQFMACCRFASDLTYSRDGSAKLFAVAKASGIDVDKIRTDFERPALDRLEKRRAAAKKKAAAEKAAKKKEKTK